MKPTTRHSVPIYTQLAGSLRAEIESGMWPVGSKLPSIEDLASRFGVATLTMRQSIIMLEGEGMLLRKHGSGTFVQKGALEQRWLSLPTDWRSLVGMIDELEARHMLVSVSDRMPHLRAGDGEPATAYKFMKRVHDRNDRPFCVVEIYLSAEIYMRDPQTFRERVVVPVMDQMEDVTIGKVRQHLRVDVADAETAHLLDIPIAGPVAKVRRTINDQNGIAIYIVDVIYRGDVVQLDMDLSPSTSD